MAEFIMKDLVKKEGMDDRFEIASAAATTEEIGNGIYPPALRALKEHGIGTADNELGVSKKRARLITRKDYEYYDYLIGMDEENMRDMQWVFGKDPQGKLYSLMEFAGKHKEVADPWYTRNFDATWNDCLEGCSALLERLKKETC